MTTATDLIWTVWIPDGRFFRVLAQYPTHREAEYTASDIRSDGQEAVVTKTGDRTDDAIRAGNRRPKVRI